MCLAESLIRVPDQATRIELLNDQLGRGKWLDKSKLMNALWLNSAIYGFEVTKSLLSFTAFDLEDKAKSLSKRLGSAGIDGLVKEVIRIMAYQFVVGESMPDAWKKSNKKHTYSFDMLGEAALTPADAKEYYKRYWEAIDFLATKRDVTKVREICFLSMISSCYAIQTQSSTLRVFFYRVLSIMYSIDLFYTKNIYIYIYCKDRPLFLWFY